jgi:hypothetical protein
MTHSSNDALTISKRSLRRLGLVVGSIVALVVIVLLALTVIRALSASDPLASAIHANEYQAVFLTNQQIYFGKLSSPGGDFTTCVTCTIWPRRPADGAGPAAHAGEAYRRFALPRGLDGHQPEPDFVCRESSAQGQAARLMGQP